MVAKISISLPKDLLDRIEQERAATGQSRSEFLAHLIKTYLKKKREEELDHQYHKGYELDPVTEEEKAFFRESAKRVWAENPWEAKEMKKA